MCKGNCEEKLTGYIEEYDDLERGGDQEVEESIYDEPSDDESSKGPKGKVLDFEKRWESRVRLIPEALDSTYVYYDPHEEENRRILNSKSKAKIEPPTKNQNQSVSSVSISPEASTLSLSKKPNLEPSESQDFYTSESESDRSGSSCDPNEEQTDRGKCVNCQL